MPCSDGLALDRMAQERRERNLSDRLNKVTRLLCHTMNNVSALERHNLLIKNPELKEWWEAHKAFDKKRKKKK